MTDQPADPDRTMPLEPDAIEEWQHRRSRLNHDWLKNRFLNRLDGILALQASPGGASRPQEEILGILGQALAEWEKRAGEVRELLGSFETEMSPRALLSSPPLCRLEPAVRDGLGAALHELWLRRTRARATVKGALDALQHAQAMQDELRRRVSGRPGGPATHPSPGTPDVRPALERFRDACREMGAAIGRLPDTIQLV